MVKTPLDFSKASSSPKLERITIDGQHGYVDETGKLVIRPQFDFAGYFSKGLAEVELNGQWYLIDKTGKIID